MLDKIIPMKELAELINEIIDKIKINEREAYVRAIQEEFKYIYFVPSEFLSHLGSIREEDTDNVWEELEGCRDKYVETDLGVDASLNKIRDAFQLGRLDNNEEKRIKEVVRYIIYRKKDLRSQIMDHVWNGLCKDKIDVEEIKATINDIEGFNGQIQQLCNDLEAKLPPKI